jgi:PAS domain S-box-containing protein
MIFIDVRTVILSHILTDAICTIVLALLWSQNQKRLNGLNFWLGDFVLQTTAALLIFLRGSIPDWISIGFSNILVLAGAFLGYIGLARFMGIKVPQIPNYTVLSILSAIHVYFVFIRPDLEARDLTLSIGLLIICAECVWLIMIRVKKSMREMMLPVGLVFALFCLVSVIRVAIILFNPNASNNFFQTSAYETLTLMTYQMLLILLAFSLALTVNRRLMMEVQIEKDKFNKAFHSSAYAITLSRLSDGKILEANESFLSITGYSSAEVIGKTYHDLCFWVNEMDRDRILLEMSTNQPVVGHEIRFRKKSGEVLIGLFSAVMINIDDQPWLLSSISDITERKKAEKEKEILARYPAENPNPVLRISRVGVIQYANSASQPLLAHWNSQVGRTLPSDWKKIIARSYQSKAHLEVEVACDDHIFSCTISPFTAKGYVNIYGIDITKRKQAEKAQVEEQNLLRTIIDNIPDRIYALDPQGRKSISNLADWKACGAKNMEDVIGKTDFDIYPVDLATEFWTLSKVVMDSGVPVFNHEERGLDHRGKPVWISSTQVPLRDSDRKIIGLVGIGRDITEHKKANEDLVASQSAALNMMEDAVEARHQLEQVNIGLKKEIKERRKAEEEVRKLNVELEHRVQERTAELITSNKELEAFSYSVSHDLRAPLRAMTGFSEAVLEEYTPLLDARGKDYLHRVSESAKRMGKLVDDLLRLSRFSRGEMIKSAVNLSQMAQQVASEIQLQDPQRKVTWVIEPNLMAMADVNLMQVVLTNLLNNAWKFTGKQKTPRIEFGCIRNKSMLTYFVKDNGVGFDMVHKDKLFGTFSRLHGQDEFEGTGIGLALVQRIIQRHGGSIWAEAQTDQGAAFYFTLA